MKIIIVGAVAAGASAAAKARRNNKDAEIVVYEKDKDISYAGCGLPYYISGLTKIYELEPRNAAFFKTRYNIDIKTGHEVIYLDPLKKKILIKELKTGNIFEDEYDRLILATGAAPVVPKIKGIKKPHVFELRNIQDAKKIKKFIDDKKPEKAVIAGGGFVGLEMAESLANLGIHVTIAEKENHIASYLDPEMSQIIEKYASSIEDRIKILISTYIEEIKEKSVILNNNSEAEADMVIIAAGIKPVTKLAEKAGIVLGANGGIKVNAKMQTNIKDIYACGDCIEGVSLITKKPLYTSLGTTANKTGKIAGDTVTGGGMKYNGTLNTRIFKFFDITVASTGLTEKEALENGYEVITCLDSKPDKASYFGAEKLVIKAVASKKDGRILGVQIIGREGADKRIDVFASLITFNAKASDLINLDLAYAPPFSTAKDPVHYIGMILESAMDKNKRSLWKREN